MYILRVTSIGGVSSSCNECKHLVDEGNILRKEIMPVTQTGSFQRRNLIPGLNAQALEKTTEDKNLAPLAQTQPEILQYGDTSISSDSTDHPDWGPGECLNLQKYTGIFRVKISRITQKVNTATEL